MEIATIVSSNSHIDYVARVIDQLDSDTPPDPASFGFGTFVYCQNTENKGVVAVVYNSLLINPEYANFGPRLSTSEELSTFSPDFLDERGVLLGLLTLGQIDDGKAKHGIPFEVLPAGTKVRLLEESEFEKFHRTAEGVVELEYFSEVLSHAGDFAVPLFETIFTKLGKIVGADSEDLNRIKILKKSLKWQRTVGQMRL